MFLHHLAQCRKAQFAAVRVIVCHLVEVAHHFAATVGGDNQIAEQQTHPAREIADGDGVGRQQFKHTAGKHGLRLFDGIQVDRVAIAFVGFVNLVKRQGAHNVGLVFGWKLVVGVVLAKIAVVYLQRSKGGQRLHEVAQIACAFRVFDVVGAGKAEGVFALVGFNRVVVGRLAGKGQQIHPLMPEGCLVAMDAVDICREDMIEQFCGGQEGFKMNWVFLVPENGGHLLRTAPGHDALQLGAGMADLAAPQLIFAAPGGFDEQQLGLKCLQLRFPVLGCELLSGAFGTVRTECELVHDARHFELTQVFHGRSGRHQCGRGMYRYGMRCNRLWPVGCNRFFFEHHLRRPGRYNDFQCFLALILLCTALEHFFAPRPQGTRQADEAAHRFEIVDEQVAQLE